MNFVKYIKNISEKKKLSIFKKLFSEKTIKLNYIPYSYIHKQSKFLKKCESKISVLNIPLVWRIIGRLDVTVLEQSLGEIVRRHEILRITFLKENEETRKVIFSDMASKLFLIDLQKLCATEQDAKVQQLIYEETQQPFEMVQWPLLRIKLLRLAEEENILILTMHSIISDRWSLGVFFRELKELYNSFSKENHSTLPELLIQYIDFIVWKHLWLQGDKLKHQFDYWKKQLNGSIPVVQLNTDRSRPQFKNYQSKRHSFDLNNNLTEKIKSLSQQENVTLFITLLSAFNTLLYRYERQEDILIGFPINNRYHEELECLIGTFVNILVIRTYLSRKLTFQELLYRVSKLVLDAYTHKDLPFEKLVEELQLKSGLRHNPMFKIMFVLNNDLMPVLELSDLTIKPIEFKNRISEFDLTLELQETSNGICGWFEYCTNLFEPDTITRMTGHFKSLLEGIVADPKRRISDLPILTELERHQVLTEWNDTKTDYPKDLCIHQLFEVQVEYKPDTVVLVFEDKQLTYRELNSHANHLAHYLRFMGVGPEVIVGIYLERSLEMVVGVLGILKSGAAYLPLDPMYPKERLTFILEDSQAPVLLSQQYLVEKLPEYRSRILTLDACGEAISNESKYNLVYELTSNNIAAVIYTSGSTGRPKGVLLEHQGWCNVIIESIKVFGIRNSSHVLQLAPFSFDVSVWEIFTSLLAGAKLHLINRDFLLSDQTLVQLILDHTITTAFLIPSVLRHLTAEYMLTLKTIITGGECISEDLVALWAPDRSFFIAYGPTEATMLQSYIECKEGYYRKPLIGRPIANIQFYLLDNFLQPVPIGSTGEICISGDGLARGYLNQPQLTVEKFILNPFNYEQNERLYKTGDLARYMPDGNIEFVGRIDQQVKIRGFRIEIREVEAVLAQHPAVKEAVVIAREDKYGEKRLVAHIVSYQKNKLPISELRNYLKQKLPEFMVPSAFMLIDNLPITPNMKVDRQELSKIKLARPEMKDSFVAPSNSVEKAIADIWCQVLDLERIGVHDNFFELGGNSLLAVRLFNEIEKGFGETLPLATLFQAGTVEQLSNIISSKSWSPPWSSLVPIQPEGSKLSFFCVHGAGGNILIYHSLAKHLGTKQPFYGLQAQGLDGKQVLHTRVVDMATHYIKEIQTVQPEGPYLVGGYCMGGTIAYEMAQQLNAQDQKVALLALFDTYNWSKISSKSFLDNIYSILQKIDFHSRNLLLASPKGKIKFAFEKMKVTKRRIKARLIMSKYRSPFVDLRNVNNYSARHYIPKSYPGKVTLFQPKRNYSIYKDPKLGWEELATGGLEIHKIPTYPGGMLVEPFVQSLAEKLGACIEKAHKIESSKSK